MRVLTGMFLSAVLAASLAGCSGGGNPAPLPVASAPAAAPGATARTGTLSFTIAVPGRSASNAAHRRLPAYVSASTAQVQIVVQGQNEAAPEGAQTFACTSVCSGTFAAPAGADRITLQLQDAGGKTLSTGVTTVIVFAGQANAFGFTLNGVVASVDLTFSNAKLPVMPAATGYAIFNARDADGNIVTYDGHYADANDAPLVFDLASSSSALTLATTTVSAPGTLIPYRYDGTGHVGSATVTPSAHAGTTTPSVTFAPASIALVPGIAQRISPPLAVAVNAVTQVPLSGTFYATTPADVVAATGPSGETFLDVATSGTPGYAPTISMPVDLPSTGTPVVENSTSGGNGLSTFTLVPPVGNAAPTYGTVRNEENAFVNGSATADPCNNGEIPLGEIDDAAYETVCEALSFDFPTQVTRKPSGGQETVIAVGSPLKILGVEGVPFVLTNDAGAIEVYAAGVKVPGATSIGQDIAGGAPLYGRADGTVVSSALPSTTALATFTKPVTALVSDSPAYYVLENRAFGIAKNGAVAETDQLPIGVPFDVIVSGHGGPPVIVENDGTLDVMAI